GLSNSLTLPHVDLLYCLVYPSRSPRFSALPPRPTCSVFFFNDTATTEIYTLSLHDALPIYAQSSPAHSRRAHHRSGTHRCCRRQDRKSTRLNSSHEWISYAVFCLKKKKVRSTCFTMLPI